MSDQKQNNLTPIGTNKREKKTKEVSKTVRFNLILSESNEEACPEFNYKDLLLSAERKRKNKVKLDGQVNGVNCFDDEDEKLKQIARQFEEKYGGSRKKHGRYDDYVDLGAGYDETDPFIDNTDAYDEIVPEEMTTAHGGFYINSGPLEFKEVSDQSDTEETKPRKRIKKVPTIQDDEESDLKAQNIAPPLKKPKLVDGKSDLVKKQKFISHDREILKKKKKRAIDDLVKKKSATVKELLREKRESLAIEPSQVADQQKVAAIPSSTITDVIESVVNAARVGDEESNGSVVSGSVGSSDTEGSRDVNPEVQPEKEDTKDELKSSGKDESKSELKDERKEERKEELKDELKEKPVEPLPDGLPDDIFELVVSLKMTAKNSAGKCKFFTTEVNQMLLSLDMKCQQLARNTRHIVYCHLASFLPCTKDTLMKRAKKLRLDAQEDRLQLPLKKLKLAIDKVMPAVLEKYLKDCQRLAAEKAHDEPSVINSGESGEEGDAAPKRKFPWSPELRVLLCEVVVAKLQCLDIQKTRRDRLDELLRTFLDFRVKSLWPPGWMKVSVLLHECREVYMGRMLKTKKVSNTVKKLPEAIIIPSSGSTVTNNSDLSFRSNTQMATVRKVPAVDMGNAKGLDLTITSTSRTATTSTPNTNSCKINSEISIIPVSVAAPAQKSPLSLKNIPDCISVTSKPVLNLKQRILHEASNSTKLDEGIEVIEIVNDSKPQPVKRKPDIKRRRKPGETDQLQIPQGQDLNEETAAATDLLQMITESLTGKEEKSGTTSAPENDEREKEVKVQPHDSKESAVQMEVDRVMKELMELQCLGEDATQPSSVTVLPVGSSLQQFKNKMAHGFQEEFHKHLFQEKPRDEIESLNLKMNKCKNSVTISPVSQPAISVSKYYPVASEGGRGHMTPPTTQRYRHYMQIPSTEASYNSASGRQPPVTQYQSHHTAQQHSPSY